MTDTNDLNSINFNSSVVQFLYCILILLTLVQYCCHYSMMMKWYRENPLDGKQIARSIQVGIPPEAPDDPNGPNDCPDNDAVSFGHTVPEADREVRSQPLAISMVYAVPGLPDEDKKTV